MGKLSLKAKNPFGADIELASGRNIIGLGLFAVMIVGITAAVNWVTSQKSTVAAGVDGLHERLRGV